MIGLNMVVFTICTYDLKGWLLGGGMTHFMHYATELNSPAVKVNLVHSWDSQSTRPWMDIFIHMFDLSLPMINLMPSYSVSDTPFSNMQNKIHNLGISYCLAGCLPPGVPKSPPGTCGFMVGAHMDVPLVVAWSWDVIERKSGDAWSWLYNFSDFSGCTGYIWSLPSGKLTYW